MGLLLFSDAAAIAHVPTAASFENIPLCIPIIMIGMKLLKLKALFIMAFIILGNMFILFMMIYTEIPIYKIVIIGTILLVIFAILLIPPNIIISVIILRIIPTITGFILYIVVMLFVMVFDWMLMKPIIYDINIVIEYMVASLLFFSAFFI